MYSTVFSQCVCTCICMYNSATHRAYTYMYMYMYMYILCLSVHCTHGASQSESATRAFFVVFYASNGVYIFWCQYAMKHSQGIMYMYFCQVYIYWMAMFWDGWLTTCATIFKHNSGECSVSVSYVYVSVCAYQCMNTITLCVTVQQAPCFLVWILPL